MIVQKLLNTNPTTDHLHVPEGAITRSNAKKIQVSNQEKAWSDNKYHLTLESDLKTLCLW